jgi:cobalt-zinc-cadmium efflux system outer membrane protein
MSWLTPTRPYARLGWTASAVLALALGSFLSAPSRAQTPLTLSAAFERAWERQPEARALAQRREAGQALRQAASAWTPEPPALEASLRSDRFNRRQGAQELELGVAVPLWLPGERQRSQDLAAAQLQAVEAQAQLAQWQLAQQLRTRWWTLLADREDAAAVEARWQAGQALALDVARRVAAGDLSRADQHQADAALASAAAERALALAKAVASEQALRALIGLSPEEALTLSTDAEVEPAGDTPAHPLLLALSAKAGSARSAAALARSQSRANPEITLLQTRDRAARGEARSGTVTLGLRFPLGSSDRHRAALSAAAADQTEAEVSLEREREQVDAEARSARAVLAAARSVLEASRERARLALEARAFFDKSFRLGETDLPTRLRVELEAGNAQRALAQARIALNQAIAQLRQSLGLPLQ